MNKVIGELLRVCGDDLRGPVSWDRVLLLNNFGGLPGEPAISDGKENRGFNIVILDTAYDPALFCKCRPANAESQDGPPAAARLSELAELRGIVPPTWVVRVGPIEAEVSRYLHGDLFESIGPAMPSNHLRSELGGILDAAASISTHSGRAMPELLEHGDPVPVRELIASAVDTLVAAKLVTPVAQAIVEATRSVEPLTRSPQHGDLWPRNVLRCKDGWRVLDFEWYGRISVPLYDTCHLLRTTWHMRGSTSRTGNTWVDAMSEGSADSAVYRDTLRHEMQRASLTPAQASAAFMHYLVDIAARMHLRGSDEEHLAPYLRDVQRLSERLALGESAEHLVFGAA